MSLISISLAMKRTDFQMNIVNWCCRYCCLWPHRSYQTIGWPKSIEIMSPYRTFQNPNISLFQLGRWPGRIPWSPATHDESISLYRSVCPLTPPICIYHATWYLQQCKSQKFGGSKLCTGWMALCSVLLLVWAVGGCNLQELAGCPCTTPWNSQSPSHNNYMCNCYLIPHQLFRFRK